MDATAHRHAEIAKRYSKRRRNRAPVTITALRIAELNRLFTSRHGHTLPDTVAGRDAVLVMAHHLARRHGDAARYIRNWIELHAPWMSADETAELIEQVMRLPLRFRADKLAQRLHLTEAERRRLGIRTIGAIDMTKAERKLQRRLEQRQRSRRNRQERARRKGKQVRSRRDYEANSISRSKPWIAAGMSRASWYRRHAKPRLTQAAE